MKKLFATIITFCLVLSSLFCFTSCKQEFSVKATLITSNEKLVVIKIEEIKGEPTLKHALDSLDKSKFFYSISADGMITSVNGTKNASDWSYYWAIYTSDADFSTTAFGTLNYLGNELGSANLGCNTLPITAGEYYALSYVKSQF